jgi:hypothetical protein
MSEKSKYWYDYDRNKPIDKTPYYYKGMVYGYKAFDIIEDYKLNYNCATALSYILRSDRKHESPQECIEKAIEHLKNEVNIIKKNNGRGYKNLK